MPAYAYALGYHGCKSSVAEKVFAGSELRPSRERYDWLGHGIYFWEDNPHRALEWAKERKYDQPAVIGAVIRFGNCLNLIDSEYLAEVARTHESLVSYWKNLEEFDLTIPENKGKDAKLRYLDCFVFEWLHSTREENSLPSYDTVRGFFSEGEPLYPGAGLNKQDHIQICVRNLDCIVGFFSSSY
ncbi:hypothetical protein [Cerasicoccus fimbriatus]|uniref:hypothetical protein n=1 Tax=Cerasicoccus fimbriatus TaxID=3014554 RepID=UPI0022B36FC5|nr:hypothetical protein [Cerasicoccus sp. TK19100]